MASKYGKNDRKSLHTNFNETHAYTKFIENRTNILVASIGHRRKGGQAKRGDDMAFTEDFFYL
jgi:hypothetical protein